MPSPGPSVLDEARAWLADDPDPDTRAELSALLERADAGEAEALAELGDRFAGRLEFGTAGLRGALGAGPNRMNRAVVIRAAAGLAAYVAAHGGRSVVVGFDARHKSDAFAEDTCAVMVGAGLGAKVLPSPLPTPVLAFAIRHLGCDAGVMVTASHNPPQDNGYKVYLGDGSQIVPPADAEISAEIDAIGPVAAVARADAGWETVDGEALIADYVAAAAAVALPGSPRDLRIAYTPLHGVGRDVLVRTIEAAGFPSPVVVGEQAEPDPDFPTVSFPNPEEPGAIDLALALARRERADLVIANDPDADRCAVAAPFPDGWRMLTGDEVGTLLASHLVTREGGARGVLACSIVSSSLLGRIAERHGLAHEETLTGFKWIARVEGLRFGYEEALGYCVDPGAVRDKDGVSAAVLVAELAAGLKAQGRTLADAVDDLAREYGLHATGQLAVRVDDLALITDAMRRLREEPPTELGGMAVEQADDLALGEGGLPPTDGLRYRLAGGARVVVRPSGTEPKLKCYLEVVEAVEGDDVGPARQRAAQRLDALRADLSGLLGL
ncbi:MAG TPA: phospho-sugar mutase [Jiangellales bacterium]|nr:phospho-sugar mutase [Jiangellales bacterium]